MIGEELRAEIEKPARKKGVAPIQQMLALLASLALIWFVFRDGGDASKPAPDGVPSPRVASTSPAITDSLVELGLAAHVVGRSGYCTSVPTAVPVVGDLRDFDAERLALARPDVLFVQPPIAGTAPELRDFCTQKSIRLVERRLDTLADIALLADDIEAVFGATVTPRLAELRGFLGEKPAIASDAPRVLVVVSADPFLAVGRGNYLDELVAHAGWRNAVDASGWVELSVEAILALRPDRIVAVGEHEAGAHEIESLLAILPWKGAQPETRVTAAPILLSPSLAAVTRREALTRLLGAPEGGSR